MKEISFLIGSGFSVPAEINTAQEINKTVANTKKEQFFYTKDLAAGFLFGRAYVNNQHEHVQERKFVEEFINFYNREIIGNKSSFNYEKFYDFFMEVYENENISTKLEAFLNEFSKRNNSGTVKPVNTYLNDFNIIYPQLIKSMVSKDFSKLRITPTPSGSYPANSDYGNFLNLMMHLGESHIVHLHSLNHDLLMENFNNTQAFRGELDDGFTTSGSDVYGELDIRDANLSPCSYHVRLPYFADDYNSNFRLYKLHGSVDRYRIYRGDEEKVIKVLKGVEPSDIFIEENIAGKPHYTGEDVQKAPDFLTGTEYKISKPVDSFNSRMFEHFSRNLLNCETLVIIGYGFGDAAVNEHLDQFVQDKNNNLVIIDVQTPNIPINIMCPHEYLSGGVSNFSFNKLTSLIS